MLVMIIEATSSRRLLTQGLVIGVICDVIAGRRGGGGNLLPLLLLLLLHVVVREAAAAAAGWQLGALKGSGSEIRRGGSKRRVSSIVVCASMVHRVI
jgi:hypothetical protein